MLSRKAVPIVAMLAALWAALLVDQTWKGWWTNTSVKPNESSGANANANANVYAASGGSVIWTLGREDGSAAEFASYRDGAERVDLTAGAAADGYTVPKGLDRSVYPAITFVYDLDAVPSYGAELKVKIVDANKAIPQMAVFANGLLSGIVQIAGVGGTTSEYAFQKTYRLYIPKEQLKAGRNEIKLEAVGCLYCSSAENKYLSWAWDYLTLEKLTAPAEEPIHGSYVLSGTNVNNMAFYYDQGAVRHLPYVLKWLGIAYSGNIMRTGCATDVANACTAIGPYYETLRDYNTQAVSFHLHTGNIKLKPDGSLPDDAQEKLRSYLTQYGSLFQYYEIDNEPGLFNRDKQVNIAVAQWLKANIPQLAPQLKTVAPGWSYQPAYAMRACKNQAAAGPRQCGNPDGWENDPQQRKELEDMTDLTNGHAYGTSYVDNKDGSFIENMLTFGGAPDGLPKPMLATEYGTSDAHRDPPQYGAAEDGAKSAAFDRIMRAHIGYADMFVQHAAFYNGYSLFEPVVDLLRHNPAQTAIHYNAPDTDSRVGVSRRLNLAYATHGRPLAYRVDNAEEVRDKLVYFRAVDTSSLQPLPGSEGTSDKLLLNFVNFSEETATLRVSVTMPEAAVYEGERFGAGDTYEAARTYVADLRATPTLRLSETLGPGEAVQYILTRADRVKPQAPSWVTAASAPGRAIALDWAEAEGARGYDVLRSADAGATYAVVAENVAATHYVDSDPAGGSGVSAGEATFRYRIRATGTDAMSEPVEAAATDSLALDRSLWQGASSSGKPANAYDDSPYTRWDTGKAQTPGQQYQLDLGRSATIDRVALDTAGSPYDYPRGYELYLSGDGFAWGAPVASGAGSVATDIRFPPQPARYLRIVQTGRAGNYWSIHDLRVYGQ
ncbi:MAG: discoidin domain-containing protein [Paenibacillaceae bacterium]|nr:discoidin domain-containing protein [Paenibacillaceae bacterium]